MSRNVGTVETGSDWDVFSVVVSPIKRNAASAYSQVGKRDAETFDLFVRDRSPLRNIGCSQSTARFPFDHGDSYDLGSRKVRFSESTGPLSSHRPMCQTTFSDNHFGSQGLRGQTGFPPNESRVNDDRYSTSLKEMSSLSFDRQYPLRSVAATSYIQDHYSIGPTFHAHRSTELYSLCCKFVSSLSAKISCYSYLSNTTTLVLSSVKAVL